MPKGIPLNPKRYRIECPDGSVVMAKNEIRFDGDLAYVKASNLDTEWFIDASDVKIISVIKWSDSKKTHRYANGNDGTKTVMMHRLLCLDEIEGMEVDHISRDQLDNRRNNLRATTRSGNASNMKPRKDSTSGYPCVTWDKAENKWLVNVSLMVSPGVHKNMNKGRFTNWIDACIKARESLTILGRYTPEIPQHCPYEVIHAR